MALFIGVICILAGIGCIAATFYLQRVEDRERVPGFYTTAAIVAIKPDKKGEQTAVTFEFTKDFQVLQRTQVFPAEAAASWITGRRSLIVYDEENETIYYNPMRRSRNRQALVMAAGFLILLFGVSWSVLAGTMLGG